MQEIYAASLVYSRSIVIKWVGSTCTVGGNMAIIKKITQPGNNLTGSLNGRIVLDEGRGRISVTDTDGSERTRQDIEGFKTFDPVLGEVVRNGLLPDNTYGLT